MKDCIFCQIVRGEVPSHKFWEDQDHIAFLSIFPNTLGFSVVIPRQHYPSYAFALPEDALSRLVIAAKQVAQLLDQKLDGVARTGLIFEGYGVDHVHAKLFPMHGTGSDSSFRPIHSSIDKFFTKYEGYISSHDWKRADNAELAALAAHLRS
jgi:diadenosine tetraphosphate (Ap4A) HIT family hydrolase